MSKASLVFVGRQYHSKTKSDQMILDLLGQGFEVKILRREQFTDSELVDAVNSANPEAVFFWCLPPSTTKHLWKIRCKNVTWAPMWDGFHPIRFRKRMLLTHSKVKVLCFSRALHNYFLKTRMKSFYSQCALPPSFGPMRKSGPYTVFLWQREAMINIKNIVKFLGESNIKKVIYKSEIKIDSSSYPFEVEVLRDWLDKESYQKKIDEADFYVAPRRAEGIGFSFLEAMQRGKVILAYDESTMNEYITHGENGYLFDEAFDFKGPLLSPSALSDKMQSRALELHSKWQKDADKIIPFIMEKK